MVSHYLRAVLLYCSCSFGSQDMGRGQATHNTCDTTPTSSLKRFTNSKITKVMSTMLVDLYPLSPATATAANNLVRCLVGAAGTAVIIQMINGMGRGWCFTFIAAVIFVTSPLLWVELKWGPKWREQRRVRVEKREEEKEARKAKGEMGRNEFTQPVDEK